MSKPATLAAILTTSAIIAFVVLFAVLWGPYYLFGSEGGLLLLPTALLILPLIAAAGLSSVILAVVALNRNALDCNRRRALYSIVGGTLMVVLPLPLLWFGNVFS